MLEEIKNRVENELKNYIRDFKNTYPLKKISPVLYNHIKEFLLRSGKRVRPSLFVVGYLGFAKKQAFGLYRSALSIELLHDFMLVHDDIIDKSDTRRGKLSMHGMLNQYLSGYKNLKFSGQDLTIVAGDVMYAMALDAFLAIKENSQRKEAALKKLIEAALYTGSGEFLELLYGIKKIGELSEADIYKVYDLKTANYTFASPLAIGAVLAGAKKTDADKLFRFGLYVGRAFQIKDDILGMFSEEKETGKSSITDLREAKKTVLIYKAYKNSDNSTRRLIEKILSKDNAGIKDLLKMRKIISSSGALDYAKNEISRLNRKAEGLLTSIPIHPKYKNLLNSYSKKITFFK